MSKNQIVRANFMSSSDKAKMGNMPRTHAICTELVGVARPGKTASDRANKLNK